MRGADARGAGRVLAEQDLEKAHVLWRGILARVRLVGAASDVIAPQSSFETDFEILRDLDPHLAMQPDGDIRVSVNRVGWHIGEPTSIDWALGARVEVVHDGRIVGRGEMVYPMIETGQIVGIFLQSMCQFDVRWSESPPHAGPLVGDWRVRLTGDPAIAIRDLHRGFCWGGQIEAVIREVRVEEWSLPR